MLYKSMLSDFKIYEFDDCTDYLYFRIWHSIGIYMYFLNLAVFTHTLKHFFLSLYLFLRTLQIFN